MGQERVPGACIASTLVALQLVAKINGKFEIIYENPHLNSAYGCRPLRLWFVNETTNNAREEIDRLKSEANNLRPFNSEMGIKVSFRVFFTMCDQKIELLKWNVGSSMRCPFCRFLQRLFHEDLDFHADPNALGDLCVSVLHFLLRVFDHFLKVALPLLLFHLLDKFYLQVVY